MNNDEFEILMDWCQIKTDGVHVTFNPYLEEDQKIIDEIIEKNKLTDLPLENFQEIVSKHQALYQAHKKLKQKQLDTYSQMSPQQIADLPLEDKLNYMDLLFPHVQFQNDLIDVCKNNEDKIKACMLQLNFPKSFWDKEKRQADRYVALIANSPDIINTVKNWENSTLDDKKKVVGQAGEIFEYVYGMPLKVGFFTPEEERKRYAAQGLSKDTHINAAYYSEGKLYINAERLQNGDNFFAVSVLFHEGTHQRQDNEKFEDPLVNRILNCPLNRANIYENIINDKQSANYKDFYAMQPHEIHAHAMQEYVENRLTEKTSIVKTSQTDLDKETKNIHNKTFTMAKIAQYHSSQKR